MLLQLAKCMYLSLKVYEAVESFWSLQNQPAKIAIQFSQKNSRIEIRRFSRGAHIL